MNKKTACKIIDTLGLKFYVIQSHLGRKLYGGAFYLIETTQLGLAPFWSDVKIKSCQSKTLQTKIYV